jgi:hypothetical protein
LRIEAQNLCNLCNPWAISLKEGTMPISDTMAGSVAEFLLLDPDTTVDQAYQELTQPSKPGIHLLTWIAIPSFAGLVITRWHELERIATLADLDIGPLRIADLPYLPYLPTPSGAGDAADARQRLSWDGALAILKPAPVLDERLHTTQQARELRDTHPGRRAGIFARGQLVRLLIAELPGAAIASKGIEPFGHGLRSLREIAAAAPALLALAPFDTGAIWQPRRLEAAVPTFVSSRRLSELWVKISLASSPGMRAELPAQTASGDSLDIDGLRYTETEIRYERGVEEISVFVEVHAPDFKLTPSEYSLQVRRTRDSATLKFQLEPIRERQASPITLTISQNAQTRATIAALTLYMDVIADDGTQASGNISTVLQSYQAPLYPIAQQLGSANEQPLHVYFVSGSVVLGDQLSVGNITESTSVALGRAAQTQ